VKISIRQVYIFVVDAFILQGRRNVLWTPVFFGFGIWLYFAIPFEPIEQWRWIWLVVIGVMFVVLATPMPEKIQKFHAYASNKHHRTFLVIMAMTIIILSIVTGFSLAQSHSYSVAFPVWSGGKTHKTVVGRIIESNVSTSGKLRLLLDQIVIDNVPLTETPKIVRITLTDGEAMNMALRRKFRPGGMVRLRSTSLSPPAGAAEPDGFDFRFLAWFESIGAVGYTRISPEFLASGNQLEDNIHSPQNGVKNWDAVMLWVNQKRFDIAYTVNTIFPGTTGALMAALLVGDRSWLRPEIVQSLRIASLSHILAISGLHMGIVCAFVFAAVRYGICLFPRLALRYNTKKIAALVTLGCGAVYLLLSGASIPTQRAYIMASAVFVAILTDNFAFSLRNVAFAAMCVLFLSPESLLSAGFHLSFSATVALVAWYEFYLKRKRIYKADADADVDAGISEKKQNVEHENKISSFGFVRQFIHNITTRYQPIVQRFGRLHLGGWFAGIVITSLIAGFATMPFAAWHFNRVVHYGLFANIVAVPIMGFAVMPSAIIALFLWPFGLAEQGLWLMELGLRVIVSVAEMVGTWPRTDSIVPAAPRIVPWLLILGGLWWCLWDGKLRILGGIAVLSVIPLWYFGERPYFLLAPRGRLLGVMTEAGRAVDHPKSSGYVARSWLLRDADRASQEDAAKRWIFPNSGRWKRVQVGDWTVKINFTRDRKAIAWKDMFAACEKKEIIILPNMTLAFPRRRGGYKVPESQAQYCHFNVAGLPMSLCVLDAWQLRSYGAMSMDQKTVPASYEGGSFSMPEIRSANYGTGERPWTSSIEFRNLCSGNVYDVGGSSFSVLKR
jgi:competence protein ComEC